MPIITPNPAPQPQTPQQQMAAVLAQMAQAADPKQAKENQLKALKMQELQADQLPNGPEKVEALQQVADGYGKLGEDEQAKRVEAKIKQVETQAAIESIQQDLSQLTQTIKRSTLSLG